MQVKLNESMQKSAELKRQVEHLKAVELLESKTKNLPSYEARKVKKALVEATAPEIERKFMKVLENVRKEAKRDAEEQESSLDSEIDGII